MRGQIQSTITNHHIERKIFCAMNENLFQIILMIIPILSTAITYFVIPYIRANIDTEKLAQYKEWASLAVKTAEMLWQETGHGKDKKQYAVDFLNRIFNARKTVISEEQINVLIEAAVRQMKEESR